MQKACLCHWQGKVQPLRNAPRAEGERGSFVTNNYGKTEGEGGYKLYCYATAIKKKKLNQIK